MNERIKREIRLSFNQMLVCHNDLTDYLEGILFSLMVSKIITLSTYYRYIRLIDTFRYSKNMISYRKK